MIAAGRFDAGVPPGSPHASAGQQPVWRRVYPSTSAATVAVHVDGHITNASTLAGWLADRGVAPDPPGAAELVALLYRELGDAALDRLKGHYAVVIQTRGAVLLARDRSGTRPLHYHIAADRRTLWFGSMLWGIVSALDAGPPIDRARMTDLMLFGRVLGSGTLLKGVRSVRPGAVVTGEVRDGRLVLSERLLPAVDPAYGPETPEAVDAGLAHALRASVAACASGHERVGVALSGGLDSSVLALVARELLGTRLATFTLTSSPPTEDAGAARRLARHLGSAHCEIALTFDDYVRAIPASISARESPSVRGSTMYLLTRQAVGRCDVGLAGFGAGDLFGEAYYDLNWELYRSRLQHKRRRAAALGLPVSEDAEAVCEAAAGADSYAAFYDSDDYRWQGIGWVASCSAASGLDVHLPFYSEDLQAFVAGVADGIAGGTAHGRDKHLLRRVASACFGDALSEAVSRPKQSLPEGLGGLHRRFLDLCDEAVDDHYVRHHEFGAYVSSKSMLVMLDIFDDLFHRRRAPEDIDMRDVLGVAVGGWAI